jgi:heterodisulfide reductase subunit C
MSVEPGAVEPSRVHEHAEWIQDGVDISGHWNRMFDPRVIEAYTPGALDRITSLVGGESLGWCYQCGKCTTVCPVDHVGDYSPRKIFRKVQTGVDLFNDPDLWLCTTCMNCLRVCPKGVNMIEIMPAVREQAVHELEAGRERPDRLRIEVEYDSDPAHTPTLSARRARPV